jgi:site-specific recombinase XerD
VAEAFLKDQITIGHALLSAGRKRGKQPVWLAKIMQYHIQPTARAVGITKALGWHVLRHSLATLLHRNGEEVKVVQELLRHSSCKITLDIYAQAVSANKRRAQSKVVHDFLPELSALNFAAARYGVE